MFYRFINVVKISHLSAHWTGIFKWALTWHVNEWSTTTDLLTFTEIISTSVDSGHQVDVMYTDPSNAFQKVPHNMPCKTLCIYGIGGFLYKWLKSNLEDTLFCVVVNGYSSQLQQATSGAPQDYKLGTILFNTLNIKSSSVLLFTPVTWKFVTKKSVTVTLSLFKRTSIVWYIGVRAMTWSWTCTHITFTRNVSPFSVNYDMVTDLGVILDKKITFVKTIQWPLVF